MRTQSKKTMTNQITLKDKGSYRKKDKARSEKIKYSYNEHLFESSILSFSDNI